MSVCPSVRPSVGPSVRWLVRNAFVFRPTRSDECRVYGPFTCFPIFFCFSFSTSLLSPHCSFLLVAISSKSLFPHCRPFLLVAPYSSSLLPMFYFIQERHFMKLDESITDGRTDGWTDGRPNKQTDGQTCRRTDGWRGGKIIL